MGKISNYPEDTVPTSNDYFLTVDAETGDNKRVKVSNIFNGTHQIATTDLSDSVVTTAKVNNSAITTAKLNDGAATGEKLGTPASFLAKAASAQAIADATFVKVQLGTEIIDRGNNFDATTNYRFTAQYTGDYCFSGGVSLGALGDGHESFCSLYVNGSEYLRGTRIKQGGSASNGSQVSGLIPLTAGDYVELYVRQSSGGSKSTESGASTYLSGHLVGRTD